MRLLLYELLTQAIILLGRLRARVQHSMGNPIAVGHRVFDEYGAESAYCCDCGLGHLREPIHPEHEPCHHAQPPMRKAAFHSRPIRPATYQYRLRFGAAHPSLAVERKAR